MHVYEISLQVTGVVKVRVASSSAADARAKAAGMVRSGACVDAITVVNAVVTTPPPPVYRGNNPKVGVHVGHCCRWHGCKYSDAKCPVVSAKYAQQYPCEVCEFSLGPDD